MTTKITLNFEKSIIDKSNAYAKKSGRSLYEKLEDYLETITQENYEEKISPRPKKIVGAVKLP